MNWMPVIFVALCGFFGAGAVSMWRTDHRGASIALIVLSLICLGIGILWLLPGRG